MYCIEKSCSDMLALWIALGLSILILLFLRWRHRRAKSDWFCRRLGWHAEPWEKTMPWHGKCPRCGKYVVDTGRGWV